MKIDIARRTDRNTKWCSTCSNSSQVANRNEHSNYRDDYAWASREIHLNLYIVKHVLTITCTNIKTTGNSLNHLFAYQCHNLLLQHVELSWGRSPSSLFSPLPLICRFLFCLAFYIGPLFLYGTDPQVATRAAHSLRNSLPSSLLRRMTSFTVETPEYDCSPSFHLFN